MCTGERRDAPSLSILDFHTDEFANRIGRHIEVAVATEGDPVETETALRRREGGILCEHFECRRAWGEFQDGRIRAVGDIYGALGVHRDVIACCRSAEGTQVVRTSPQRARCLNREDSQDRARARCARSDEYGALRCARFDANDSTIPQAPDKKSTIA